MGCLLTDAPFFGFVAHARPGEPPGAGADRFQAFPPRPFAARVEAPARLPDVPEVSKRTEKEHSLTRVNTPRCSAPSSEAGRFWLYNVCPLHGWNRSRNDA